MARLAQHTLRVLVVAGLTAVAGCADGPLHPGKPQASAGIILSDPGLLVPQGSAEMAPALATAGLVSRPVVYLSLPSDSIPTGARAVLRHRESGFTVTEMLRDGSLEPVPVAARVGDVIDIDVYDALGARTPFSVVVPANRKPRVVRTIPARGKTDVPLNGTVIMIFSEPIDPDALTSGVIKLLRGNRVVSGRLAFVDSEHVAIEFIPAEDLASRTTYRLMIAAGVSDIDGESLGTAVSVDFATGSRVAGGGPVTSIVVSPDPATVIVGQAVRYSVIARDASGQVRRDVDVEWKSNVPAVANFVWASGESALLNGLAVAARPGSATISATIETVTATATLTVLGGPPDSSSGSIQVTTTTTGEDLDPDGYYLMLDSARGLSPGLNDTVLFADVSPGSHRIMLDAVAANCVVSDGGNRTVLVESGATTSVNFQINCAWPSDGQVTWIYLTPETPNIETGSTVQFRAYAMDQNSRELPGRATSWSTSNAAVATVSTTGLVTAISAGSATITATVDTVSATQVLTVASTASVSISPAPGKLVVDGQVRFAATPMDAAGNPLPDRVITWSTSNAAVVTVSDSGLATGRATGSATITATTGGRSASVSVNVELVTFASVATGAAHSCGLSPSGSAYCWGDDGDGALGSLSTLSCGPFWMDDRDDTYYEYFVPCNTAPTAVSGNLTFSALSAGENHSCGLTAGGQAYCWGSNGVGKLGTSNTSSSATPVAVSGGHTFRSVSAGVFHSCGVTTGGSAYCWGSNLNGALGSESPESSSIPLLVSGGITFATVSAAHDYSCGLTVDGLAYCWGSNMMNQLGSGAVGGSSSLPVQVAGGIRYTQLSAGVSHSCALKDNGEVFCWGANGFGQLGIGAGATSATPVQVSGGIRFASLSTRGYHTCGVSAGGGAYCWGYNASGQLGTGTSAISGLPSRVAGGLNFLTVGAGAHHTCGVSTGGTTYCWGYGAVGQLGDGTMNSSAVPVRVKGQP